MTSTVCAVIFDMDGVLIDSAEGHFAAWHQMGVEQNQPYSRSLFDRTFGMHNSQTIPLWLGHPLSDSEIAALADRKEVLYREAARASLKPIAGAVRLVQALARAGFLLAVGSSGPLANTRLALEILGIRPLFQALSTGDDVTNGKPAPDIFLHAAHLLNVSPNYCVVIEDAPPGIEAAHAAGMRVIAIPTSRHARELARADLVVPTLLELSPDSVKQLLLLN